MTTRVSLFPDMNSRDLHQILAWLRATQIGTANCINDRGVLRLAQNVFSIYERKKNRKYNKIDAATLLQKNFKVRSMT